MWAYIFVILCMHSSTLRCSWWENSHRTKKSLRFSSWGAASTSMGTTELPNTIPLSHFNLTFSSFTVLVCAFVNVLVRLPLLRGVFVLLPISWMYAVLRQKSYSIINCCKTAFCDFLFFCRLHRSSQCAALQRPTWNFTLFHMFCGANSSASVHVFRITTSVSR